MTEPKKEEKGILYRSALKIGEGAYKTADWAAKTGRAAMDKAKELLKDPQDGMPTKAKKAAQAVVASPAGAEAPKEESAINKMFKVKDKPLVPKELMEDK